MKHEIMDSPDFGMLKITFESPGEKIIAESGAMVAMSDGLGLETNMRGGLLAAAKRKLLGGESLFQNTFTATASNQELYISPPVEGDLRALNLNAGETFFLQSGAYVAHIGDELQLDTKWGGAKNFFGGVGLFILKAVGPGTVYYSSYGALHEVEISGGYTCDNGHMIGWTDGLDYSVRKFGGFKGLFFSGEGLVCDFQGQGRLYLQTRNPSSLASFLHRFRPVRRRSS